MAEPAPVREQSSHLINGLRAGTLAFFAASGLKLHIASSWVSSLPVWGGDRRRFPAFPALLPGC